MTYLLVNKKVSFLTPASLLFLSFVAVRRFRGSRWRSWAAAPFARLSQRDTAEYTMAPVPPQHKSAAVDEELRASGKVVDLPPNTYFNPAPDLIQTYHPPPPPLREEGDDDDIPSDDDDDGDDLEKQQRQSAFNDGASAITYVDFVPPPPPPVSPPAKYKLWILIFVIVYFGVWFAQEAQVVQALTFGGWLGPQAAYFLLLNIMVFTSTFGTLDLLVRAFTVSIRGRKYGIEAWLKQPRAEWLHKCKGSVLMELLASIVVSFEDGFEIFNPTDTPRDEDDDDLDGTNPGFEPRASATGEGEGAPGSSDVSSNNNLSHQVMLKIEYRIKPELKDRYVAWSHKIARRAAAQPGFVRVVRERNYDETNMHCRHVVYLTFSNINTLNDWITSPDRDKLSRELKPMLAVDDENNMKLVQHRELPDAFTDLLVRQGDYIPPRPPKKWKVYWLTACGLFFATLIREKITPYYYSKWGIADDPKYDRLVAFCNVLLGTFLVSYVMQPLFIMQFSEWVRRKPNENDKVEPWRTLNDGFKSTWMKAVVALAYFGGCGIRWAILATRGNNGN